MAESLTNAQLVELIRKSGIVEGPRVDAFLGKLGADAAKLDTPGKLAGRMVREGLLTKFQAEQFLQGRWRGFTLGKYKLLEKLGAGGMGAVYLAEHVQMRRRVALKVLPPSKAKDPASLERFYREARAVAALDHPNIVRAHDVDNEDKTHFLVMEFVEGVSLQGLVDKRGPLDIPRATHYVWQTALGLQHAHESGLIHRDIKPANLLVHRSGVLKILDMGLARFFLDQADNLSREYNETVMGTVDYLSPEQAIDSHTVDIRADIYSLGATFYYLLTGKTMFGDGTVAQKFLWHQMRAPAPIQTVCPAVPAGLANVIEKMLAKDPADRYQSPAELAEALTPWVPETPPVLTGEEVPRLSLAASSGQKATSMVVPSPSLVAASATQGKTASGASKSAGPASGASKNLAPAAKKLSDTEDGNGPYKVAQDKADTADADTEVEPGEEKRRKKKFKTKLKAEAEEMRRRYKRLTILCSIAGILLIPLLVMVYLGVYSSKPAPVVHRDPPPPNVTPPTPQPPPPVKVTPPADGSLAAFPGHAGQVWAVAFAANSAQVLSGGDDNLRLWDVASGKVQQQFAGQVGRPQVVALSRDGQYFLANSVSAKGVKEPAKNVFIWRRGNPDVAQQLLGHDALVTCAAFSPNGKNVLTGGRDKSVRLWDVDSGQEIRKFDGHKDSVGAVAFAPNGFTILSASGGDWKGDKLAGPGERVIRLWDADSGEPGKQLKGHTQPIECAVFSPDGKRILSGGRDNTIRLWDVASGKELKLLDGHTDRVVALAFVAGGSRALSCSFDQTIRLWDLTTFKEIKRLDVGPAAKHKAVAFSPDGKRAASASDDKTVRIWKVPE